MTARETTALQSIRKMKAELEKAVQSEDFEAAARLRDKIRELEGKSKAGGADQ